MTDTSEQNNTGPLDVPVITVQPMYTSDTENQQHMSMLEYRRLQIANIYFVKK